MLEPGTRLGPYEIIAPLGAGGMGEVLRARDTRLGREVAIKVLPQHLSANAEVRSRFEREAKTVSSLNHPNICTLFDVGREGDVDFLVMELIDGETLADRLRRGPVPAPELLRLGVQIADALDRAHRAGVIHRDLKPGNVMITRSGAKLMDFGLARATGMAGAGGGSGATLSALTQSPTVAHALTAEGTIIGTFQYMAPEQLEGREADARSDLWSFGCVLYEMATGRRAFEGRSQASLIAAILEREPAAVADAPSGAPASGGPPPGLDRLIRACLAKDPDERLQTAHDAKLQLQWIAESVGLSQVGPPPSNPVAVAAPARRSKSRLAWTVAAVSVLVAIGALLALWPAVRAPKAAYRFRTEPVPGVVDYFWPRVSPDGRYLVFDSQDSSGKVRAWLRPFDQTEALPIAGTEGLQRAYWSPDSREIAFVANGKIQRVPISGGAPIVVSTASQGSDLSWGSKGDILMDGRTTDSLCVVPARGGELRPATRVDHAANEIGSAWPCFLPDGEHFLFIGTTAGTGISGHIRLGRLGTLESKYLGDSDGRAEYGPGGWVLYLRGASLLARKLDLAAGKLQGQPITLAENLRVGTSAGHFSVSPAGILAYGRGDDGAASLLQEADRSGRLLGGPLGSTECTNPQLSPDGRALLYQVTARGTAVAGGIWKRDLVRGTETKLTFFENAALTPMWSPDGRRFACISQGANGEAAVLVGSSDGLGALDSFSVGKLQSPRLTQWAAAGSQLLIGPADFDGVFTLDAEHVHSTPQAIAGLPARLAQSVLSPDGHYLAYAWGENGAQPQVYVQSVVGPPGRWQISTSTGFNPRWTREGRELVYEGDGRLNVVSLEAQAGFRPGTPQPLFSLPIPSSSAFSRTWSCSEDGEHFYLLVPPKTVSRGGIEVVTDFRALAERK